MHIGVQNNLRYTARQASADQHAQVLQHTFSEMHSGAAQEIAEAPFKARLAGLSSTRGQPEEKLQAVWLMNARMSSKYVLISSSPETPAAFAC